MTLMQEMDNIFIRFEDGSTLRFRGFYLGSTSTAWDSARQVEREEYDVFELYVDDKERYYLIHKKVEGEKTAPVSYEQFDDASRLKVALKDTPASRLLEYLRWKD